MTQQQLQPVKSELRSRLETLPNEAIIKAGGHTFVKEGSMHLRTNLGVLTFGDFEKFFQNFEIVKQENK